MKGVLGSQSHLFLDTPPSHSAIAFLGHSSPPRPLGWEKRCRLGSDCCSTGSCSCLACGLPSLCTLGLVVGPPPGLLTLLLLSRPLPTVTQQPLCPPSPAWCDSWLLLGKILGVTTLPTIPAPTTSLAPRLPQECWLTSPCLAPHPIILMNPKSSWPGTLCLLGVSLPYPTVHAMTEAGQGSGSPHTPKSS